MIDLIGTNTKVEIGSTNSYREFIRIYKFINFVMKVFTDFIETGAHADLFKKIQSKK